MTIDETFDSLADLAVRTAKIRTEMGGLDKIERIHARGERTIREHLDGFLDEGSFHEIGTFSHSMRPQDAATTPGDGKIGGVGTIDGAPVMVGGVYEPPDHRWVLSPRGPGAARRPWSRPRPGARAGSVVAA